jgi:competence protein ComFC
MEPILNFFFPKCCVGCGKFGNYFCSSCIQNITQSDLVCPSCERPAISGVTHPLCKRRYGLDGLWFLGVYHSGAVASSAYQNPLKKAIQKLKYRWVKDIAQELVYILVDYWARYQPFLLEEIKKSRGEGWVVTAVPLHWQRQNWRGFNQSAEIAKLFAQNLGLEYKEVLVRTRNTKSQAKLLSYDRKHNVRNAFKLDSSLIAQNDMKEKNVILIDDVWTTGSTLKECTYVLKRAGAQQVWALTIAR